MVPHLEFSLSHPWVSAVFILAALGLAVYSYQSADVSRPMKAVLITLRTAALFLTFILILEPVLSTIYTKTQPPALAVLADNSESMTIQDGTVRRDSLLQKLLTNHKDSLSGLGDVQSVLFGKSATSAPFDSLFFRQKQTDISDAIRFVVKGNGEKKPDAILLVTDGQFTAGENPVYAGESSPIPIYTVLIGDTTKKRDVALNRIIAPKSAFANTRVSVSVVLTQKGFTNQTVRLRLSGENGISEEKLVMLAAPEHTVTFELEPKEPGEKKFTVQAQPLSGEFSNRNNSSAFFIDILKSKKKVLVISGLADPEVSAVRNALHSNGNLEVDVFTQRDANSFLLRQFDPNKHAGTDVCILTGFPNGIASPAFLEKIHQFLTSNRIPVLSVLSVQSASAQLRKYEDLLAVEIDRPNSGQVLENAFVYPSQQGISSSIFKSVSSDLEERLRQAGPVLYPDLGFRPKADATVLWKLAQNNVKTEKPVFAIGKNGRQKVATLAGAGFWQFWLSQDANVKALYEQTLLNTIEWLTTKDDVERFRVEPLSRNFEASDGIQFSAILQDELLQPVSSAEIALQVRHQKSGEEFKTVFEPSAEAGFYKAGFESLPEGDYTYTAEAKENGKQAGLVTGLFSVSKSDIEFRTPNADAETLREIAKRSGGKFYVPATFPEFFTDIKKDIAFQTAVYEEKSSVELANLTTMLLVIVGILTLEWALRKFKALP